jgi:hypothetical protein
MEIDSIYIMMATEDLANYIRPLRFASAGLPLFSNHVHRLKFSIHFIKIMTTHCIRSIEVGSVFSLSQHMVHALVI